MKRVVTKAARLSGELEMPGDKSITHRAMIIGAMAKGWSEFRGALNAGDTRSTKECLDRLGVETNVENGVVRVHGRGLHGFARSSSVLDTGNSGTTLRLLTGLLVGQRFNSKITGDDSLVRRPMERIIDPLSRMGARIEGTEFHTPPLSIHAVDALHPIEYTLKLRSAQVKSAIILAGLYAEGITRIEESVRSRDHTERMLELTVREKNGRRFIEVEGGMKIEGRSVDIPGDLSSAAFFLVAGSVVPNSELVLKNVCMNPTRTGVIDLLRSMGANIDVENKRMYDKEPVADLVVRSSDLTTDFCTKGGVIANIIDEIPALSVAAALAKGSWEVRDAAELRNKESDRIRAVVANLRSVGVMVHEYGDGFLIEGGKPLVGKMLESFGDHRIAMMSGILGLTAEGSTGILGAETAEMSFPDFWDTLKRISS